MKTIKELEKELYNNNMKISTLKNYEYEKYLYAMIHLTSQIYYFYHHIAKDGPSDNVFYCRNFQSLEHRMIYINLGRGFPKELMDGHWCYVVKDYGCKILVIPSTSIKADSVYDTNFDMDIISKDKNKTYKSRLCITEMRTVDIQRIDIRKEHKIVITPKNKIKEFIKNKIF